MVGVIDTEIDKDKSYGVESTILVLKVLKLIESCLGEGS